MSRWLKTKEWELTNFDLGKKIMTASKFENGEVQYCIYYEDLLAREKICIELTSNLEERDKYFMFLSDTLTNANVTCDLSYKWGSEVSFGEE